MSTILKALKKLEQDKLRKGEGKSEIAFDIFKSPPRSVRPGRIPVVGISVVFLALVAATAFYMVSAHQQVARNSQPPMPLPGGKASTEEISGRSLPTRQQTNTAAPARLHPPAQERTTAASLPESRESKQPDAAQPDGAEIVPERRWSVSGIAWRRNDEARLAVINGLPVMTGTVIDDATVTAIEEDRVILSYKGKSLPVLLDPSTGN